MPRMIIEKNDLWIISLYPLYDDADESDIFDIPQSLIDRYNDARSEFIYCAKLLEKITEKR